MRRVLLSLAVATLSACALFGPSKEDNPRDVEAPSAPRAVDGACDGDDAPTLAPSSFYAGPYQASSARPPAGALIAFEGVPRARLVCTQRGCASECCENGCGAELDCAYALVDDANPTNTICLAHDAFTCGGTDCSPFCEPFSSSPKERYRFVGKVEYREESLGRTPILRVERFCVAD